jgi:hypothetical protein
MKKGVALLEKAAKLDVAYAKKLLYEIDRKKYRKYREFAD